MKLVKKWFESDKSKSKGKILESNEFNQIISSELESIKEKLVDYPDVYGNIERAYNVSGRKKFDLFLKDMVEDNFKKNSILGAIMGTFTSIWSFNLGFIVVDFLKSLILPLILGFLFLPVIYIIAVLNEYLIFHNLSPYLASDYGLGDVFKKYTINLHELHRFNWQRNYKSSSNVEAGLLDSGMSDFRLANDCIYMGNALIGRYECNVEMPEICGRMSEAYTIEKKIPYVVGDWEVENSGEDMAFVYFIYGDVNVKLFVGIEYDPMHIWSPLIEEIYEFGLL